MLFYVGFWWQYACLSVFAGLSRLQRIMGDNPAVWEKRRREFSRDGNELNRMIMSGNGG